MPKIQVEQEVWLRVAITPWVSWRLLASPGVDYDSGLGEGEPMAKFTIQFVGNPAVPGARPDEVVDADKFVDKPPFVDFYAPNSLLIARYRQDDIRRILREG
jgi:hypothetical protein